MSWGVSNLNQASNVVRMDVKAFKFIGTIEIRYISNRDLFRITLINEDGTIHYIEKDLPVHMVVDKIDSLIELLEDYEKVVKMRYKIQ